MNAPPPATGVPTRLEDLGRTPGEREAAYARGLETIRAQVSPLRICVDETGTRGQAFPRWIRVDGVATR
jgi:hypothetical protein